MVSINRFLCRKPSGTVLSGVEMHAYNTNFLRSNWVIDQSCYNLEAGKNKNAKIKLTSDNVLISLCTTVRGSTY